MNESMRFRSNLRVVLPLLHILLAILLSVVGHAQTRGRMQWNMIPWDYIAPAELLMHSINFPAAVLTSLTTSAPMFHIGLEYSIWRWLVYLLSVGLLWRYIGIISETGLQQKAGKQLVFYLHCCIGILFGSFLLLLSLSLFEGPHGLLLIVSGLIWSVLLLSYFSIILLLRLRSFHRRAHV